MTKKCHDENPPLFIMAVVICHSLATRHSRRQYKEAQGGYHGWLHMPCSLRAFGSHPALARPLA